MRIQPDATAMRLNNCLGKIQAQARAFCLASGFV